MGNSGVMGAVAPVPKTSAAEVSAAQKAWQKTQPMHTLLDPRVGKEGRDTPRGLPSGMSPAEAADRIAARLLEGSGPILLVAPGTLGTSYQTSMFVLAKEAIKATKSTGLSVASIPYDNGIFDLITRFIGMTSDEEANVLALVLHRLQRFAPHRKILLAGESQGAWLIADTLRANPELAKNVDRVALFALPGFAKLPTGVGDARSGVTGLQVWRHIDDLVPHLGQRIPAEVVKAGVEALKNWYAERVFHYPPHHYDANAPSAVDWLINEKPPKPESTTRLSSATS